MDPILVQNFENSCVEFRLHRLKYEVEICTQAVYHSSSDNDTCILY